MYICMQAPTASNRLRTFFRFWRWFECDVPMTRMLLIYTVSWLKPLSNISIVLWNITGADDYQTVVMVVFLYWNSLNQCFYVYEFYGGLTELTDSMCETSRLGNVLAKQKDSLLLCYQNWSTGDTWFTVNVYSLERLNEPSLLVTATKGLWEME